MRIGRSWRGPQISRKQAALEARRLRVAWLLKRGHSIRRIARAVGRSKSTAHRDVVVIRSWPGQRLSCSPDLMVAMLEPREVYLARVERVMAAAWGSYATDRRLRGRLRRVLWAREAALRYDEVAEMIERIVAERGLR